MNLQESIRRILREETENRGRSKLINIIKSISLDAAIKVVSSRDNLLKVLDVNTPMEFLNIFDDLKSVQSLDHKRLMLYRYKAGDNIFVYDKVNNNVHFNYRVWSILRYEFDLNYSDTQEICTRWLEKTYGLKVNKVHSSINSTTL